MEAKLKVKLVAHTINPELTIATAGKLCYSPVGVEELLEKQTEDSAAKFINMLINMGHQSPLEHCSFTFAIEGVSRALTHQLVRHRLASYSQQSQRYVKENQFDFIVPRDIKKDSELIEYYHQHMFMTQALYDVITDGLLFNYLTGADEVAFFARECAKAKVDRYDLVDILKNKMVEVLKLEVNEDEIELMSPHSLASKINDIEDKRLVLLEVFENALYKKLLNSLTKRAIENARYIFPNAIETKIMVTMNLRSLINFCKHRCCCYDEETEVLTTDGWKFFKDLKHDDVFYSLNKETMDNEYVHANKIMNYDYAGNMVRVKSQSIDQLITPNHKMLVSYSYDNKEWVLDEAEEHKNHKKILMKKNCNPIKGIITDTLTMEGLEVLDRNQHKEWTREIPSRDVDIKDFMQLLGFYLSDGYSYKSGFHYVIGFSKGSKELLEKYFEILTKMSDNTPRIFEDKTSYKLELHDRRLFDFFSKLGNVYTKRIPDFVWKYDYTILEYLYKGFEDGDMNSEANSIWLSSEKMIDDFQRLIFHLGFSSSKTSIDRRGRVSEGFNKNGDPYKIETKNISYQASVNRTKNEPIIKATNRSAFSEEWYEGKVYCVELEKNHILYIRRNGKTVWSGNSRSQLEIQHLAFAMRDEVAEISPLLARCLGASCQFGSCPEGAMTCGKPYSKL